RVVEPGRVDVVQFFKSINWLMIQPFSEDFFPVPVKVMDRPVEVPVLPSPVKELCSPPSHPAVATGHLAEERAFDDVVISLACDVPASEIPLESEHEVFQVSCTGQRRKGSKTGLELVIELEIHASSGHAPTV